MLFVLWLWLTLSHNTTAEFWIHEVYEEKIMEGFFEINSEESFYAYERGMLRKLFFPDIKHSSYETSEEHSYANVAHMSKAGLD